MKLTSVGASLLATFVLATSLLASELPELAHGLDYLRIHSLVKSADDLRAALLRPAPLVIDFRYTADEPTAAAILRELNTQPAKPTLYVLVSPATPTSVAEILAASSARFVTLGVKDSRPAAQIVVSQTPEADRAAYDALTSGSTLAELISGRIEKERFDEATLVQEFKNGHPNAQPPAPPAPTTGPNQPAATPPEKPIDRVLQRALHLHRALQALKR